VLYCVQQQHVTRVSSGGSSWLQRRVLLMCWGCLDGRRLAEMQQQQVSCGNQGVCAVACDVLGMLGREEAGGGSAGVAAAEQSGLRWVRIVCSSI
jgi:hypothetical protein